MDSNAESETESDTDEIDDTSENDTDASFQYDEEEIVTQVEMEAKKTDLKDKGIEYFLTNRNQSAVVNDGQENQSARSLKSHHSRKTSRISISTKEHFIEVKMIDGLPMGCLPISLSEATLSAFKINLEETVSIHKPMIYINKDLILTDITNQGAASDFNIIRSPLLNYDAEQILIAYDPTAKFGENFIIASTELARYKLIKLLTYDEEDTRDEVSLKSMAQRFDDKNAHRKGWKCHGSDNEINESHVILKRPLIRSIVRRLRRDFGTDIDFTEKSSKKDYVEVRKYEDLTFSLRNIEQNKNESNAPCLSDIGTNTLWRYPRNAHTQYVPRSLPYDECAAICLSEPVLFDSKLALPYLVESLQHNEIANYFMDDYGGLAPGDTIFDTKTDNDLREFQTFADLKLGRDKAVTNIQWHPTIKGIIATSMAEKSSFDQRIDNMSKVILSKSYIIFWSFLDPIQPQLLLEAPADIICFQFNLTDAHFVAGGCINGQLILWDVESHMDDLRNVKARMKLRNVIPLFSFDNDTSPKILSMRPSAVSHCESSHSAPITDLKWLPDHYEVNNLGYSLENLSQKSVQIATAAGDNKILFWDIRQNKAVTALPDKLTSALPTPVGVPETFKYLDMKWKPTLRVHVYKTGIGSDYSPTRFSLKEVQGDRRVLDMLEDKENRLDDTMKSNVAKARTLQNLNTRIFVGTEDGELVYVDWMPQKDTDTGKLQTPRPDYFWNIHDGPINCVTRCPFDRSLLLVIGGWIWTLWKEEVKSGPIIQCCTSEKPLTNGTWSPTKASIFFITRADGTIEIWDILDKTHEPTLVQNISSTAALTSISIFNFVKKQLIAIGDINGGLHVYEIPQRFKLHSQSELNDTAKYIEREVKRRDFVQRRWNLREQEKIEKEVEIKKKAGIAPQVTLTDDEIKARMKAEYDVYVHDEQAFLRELGLKENEEEK